MVLVEIAIRRPGRPERGACSLDRVIPAVEFICEVAGKANQHAA